MVKKFLEIILLFVIFSAFDSSQEYKIVGKHSLFDQNKKEIKKIDKYELVDVEVPETEKIFFKVKSVVNFGDKVTKLSALEDANIIECYDIDNGKHFLIIFRYNIMGEINVGIIVNNNFDFITELKSTPEIKSSYKDFFEDESKKELKPEELPFYDFLLGQNVNNVVISKDQVIVHTQDWSGIDGKLFTVKYLKKELINPERNLGKNPGTPY